MARADDYEQVKNVADYYPVSALGDWCKDLLCLRASQGLGEHVDGQLRVGAACSLLFGVGELSVPLLKQRVPVFVGAGAWPKHADLYVEGMCHTTMWHHTMMWLRALHVSEEGQDPWLDL